MKTDDPDLELAGRFAEIRRADEAAAPDLNGLLQRPPRLRRPPGRGRRLALAAALGLVAVAAALLLRARTPGRTAATTGAIPPAAAQLAAWKSPTASLLRTSGADLLSRAPVLLPRVPVFATVTLPQTTKGADR